MYTFLMLKKFDLKLFLIIISLLLMFFNIFISKENKLIHENS